MYTDKPAVFNFRFVSADAAAVFADNSDIAHIMIPANCEVEVQNVMGYVAAASDGADFIELVKEDDTVICKIALQTTGHKSAVNSDGSTATTFPQRVAPQSTTLPKLLKLRMDGASDATTDVSIQVHLSGLRAVA